jgi:hypothetical protein
VNSEEFQQYSARFHLDDNEDDDDDIETNSEENTSNEATPKVHFIYMKNKQRNN